MASLNEQAARTKIHLVLSTLGVTQPGLRRTRNLFGGKLYELFVLSRLLIELANRGYSLQFSHPAVGFKTGGGPIKPGDFHVDVLDSSQSVVAKIYTDVEVRTLGASIGNVSDFSQYHETDIAAVQPNSSPYPEPDDLLIGIECKATAKFQKSHVREVLGRRRELSLYTGPFPAPLHPGLQVMAKPASEYWLCFIDPAGMNYVQSPAVFSVELKHWQP